MRCIDKTKDMGYIQAHQWLAWMTKRYEQHQCGKCSLWHVWKRRPHRGLDDPMPKDTPVVIGR